MAKLLTKNRFSLRAASFSVLLSIAFSLLPLSANAQTTEPPSRQLVMKEKTLGELPRYALVIGNAKYKNMLSLNNSSADAVDMAAALRSLNFEVLEGVDQSKKQMRALITEFGEKLYRNRGIGVFFYAGHGVQSKGANYLIPVDADIPTEGDIEFEAEDLGRLLAKFAEAKNDLNIVILDACRNNPLAKEWSKYRSTNVDDGLAKINAPKGTVLFYATEPGKAASDGAGRNGLFTEVLLENIKKPNLEFDALSKAVTRGVAAKSKQAQIPYKEGTSFSDFYFAGENANPVLPAPVVKINESETEPEIVEKTPATVERESWNEVKNSSKPQVVRGFLEDFPNGVYTANAKKLLEQISWNSIKTTTDKALFENYLKDFPNGANAPTVRTKLRKIEAEGVVETARTETAKTEPARTESKTIETAEPKAEETAESSAKKEIVPKAEMPKAAARTVKSKVKTSAVGTNKFDVRKNALEMEFVQLPAGSFMMGSSEANVNESYSLGRKEDADIERGVFDDEKPQRRVTFASGFWIGKTEVTQAQWTAVMNANPSLYKDCGDCPVERVSWEGAQKFIEKMNALNDGFVYRLPSEAEWEYAARGGKSGNFTGRATDIAWHHDNSADGNTSTQTHPVGMLQPNAFGLYDMQGNVAEWCEDVYTESYENSPVDGTANTTGNAENRVLRGGFFNDLSYRLRLPRRNKLTTKIQRSENGLRVVAVEKQ